MPRLFVLLRVFAACAALSTATVFAAAAPLVEPATEQKITALLGQMTLEEKVGQLTQDSSSFDLTGPAPKDAKPRDRYERIRRGAVGSMLNVCGVAAVREAQRLALENSRLKIPMIFGYDVIHGYRTCFPVPLGEAASWNLTAIEATAHIAAMEAAASGLNWTFAPMVDIARDARWGRVMEGAGEDPYLGGLIAAARVRGFQGADLKAPDAIAACAKHFAGYGFAEAGRDYNVVDISEQTLRNVVLPPFKAAVDAGAATLMNSFNEIGGLPATANAHILRDILKGEWGFNGFVVSDWQSIGELRAHGVARDLAAAAQLAITAGSDMDMEARAYGDHLVGLVHSGVVPEALVDDAVRRVLRVKFAVGLFEDPFRHCDLAREKAVVGNPAFLATARDVARKSIVLLKNDGGLLPLSPALKKIAVIGPLAADKETPLGGWRGQALPDSAVSLLEGVKAAAGPATKIVYAEGAKLLSQPRDFAHETVLNTTDRSGFPAAVAAARSSDLVIMAVGEDAVQTGEARSQADIGLKGLQEELLHAVYAVNKRVVVVLMNGRPLTIPWVADHVPAIVEAWHLGSEAGHGIADVLFGRYNPSGRLPISFPRAVGQVPIYYNHKSTGRPLDPEGKVFWSHYTDVANEPQYPFGFGLSYTTFAYSDLRLGASTFSAGGSLPVAVTVTNTGKVAGTETVQLYVRDLVGSVTRPVKELKGFRQITLQPGEAREVTFTLTAADLAFYTARGVWEAEPGEFQVFVGASSRDAKSAEFVLR